MMSRRSRISSFIASLLFVLTTAGCGDDQQQPSNQEQAAAQTSSQQQSSQQASSRQTLRDRFLAEGAGISLGSYQAPVDVFVFSDFQCQSCKTLGLSFLPYLRQNYIKNQQVEFTFFDYPLQQAHPHSLLAHRAARCLQDRGGFWRMHDLLLENQQEWSAEATDQPGPLMAQYAQQAGGEDFRQEQWQQCMESGLFRREILGNVELARGLDITAVPAIFVNYERVRGGGEEILEVIEQELQQGGSGNGS